MSEHGSLDIDSDQYHCCDYCGEQKQTAWIHGKLGIYDLDIQQIPVIAPPTHQPLLPERQGELHLYLCGACLREALSRVEPAPARC